MKRASHDVIAFRAIFAANILEDADVTVFDDEFDGAVTMFERGAVVRTGEVAEIAGSIVGSAGEEDAGVFSAFWNDDDGVEFDAVTHGDHDVALFVVKTSRGRNQSGGGFAGEVGILGGLGSLRASGAEQERSAEEETDCQSFTEQIRGEH